MEWVETTGRTVEEAKKAALEQLGVAEPEAEFEVVTEPRLGLFGRLKEEARIRARLLPRYPRPKGERRDRKRSTPAPPTDESGRRTPGTSDQAPAARDKGRSARRAPVRQGRPGGGAGLGRQQRGAETQPAAEASVPSVDKPSLQTQARLGEDFLRGLLEHLGAEAAVSSEVQADGLVELKVSGRDLGILIGSKGTTLLALQELTRTVIQRHAPSQSRIIVDVNDYRKRRHEALAKFARQVAEQVLATKTRRALEPMPAADRKVVHDAINGVPGVTTISEGEEPGRRVVIVPDAGPTAEDGAGEAGAPAPARSQGEASPAGKERCAGGAGGEAGGNEAALTGSSPGQ